MTDFKERLIADLAQRSLTQLAWIGVLSIWTGVGATMVNPTMLAAYGIAGFEILRSRGASRRRRATVAVVVGLNIPLLLIWATGQFSLSETLLVLGLPASLCWMGWDSLRSNHVSEPQT